MICLERVINKYCVGGQSKSSVSWELIVKLEGPEAERSN